VSGIGKLVRPRLSDVPGVVAPPAGASRRPPLDPDEVEALLQAAARDAAPLTYAEALGALGHRFTRPLMRQLCRVLTDVDARARGAGHPELAVLVVRQSDGLPGQGWWMGREDWRGAWVGPDARAFVGGLQQAAFAYWAKR
jgi:hypothetical protein